MDQCERLFVYCKEPYRRSYLPHQVRLLENDIRRASKAADCEASATEVGRARAVLEGHGPGGDLRKLLKQTTPALLRMLLGPKINVVTLQARLGALELRE